MFGIFKNIFGGDNTTDRKTASGTKFSKAEKTVLRELDFEAAVAAHHAWKDRLASYLAGNSLEYFRPDIVGLNNRCSLGKWLESAKNTTLSKHPAFQSLMSEHQNFHFHAAYIVSYTHAGKLAEAQKVFNEGFEVSSQRVLTLLREFA